MVMASKASIFRWFLPTPSPSPSPSPSDPQPTASSPPTYAMTDPDHTPSDPHPEAEDSLHQGLRCLVLKREEEAEGDRVEVEEGKGGDGEKEKSKVEEREGSVEVERGEGVQSVRYPVRPEAEDCSYYMRTGNCKFGSDCKFNHPVVRKYQDKVKEEEESRDRASRTECKFYLKTGGCKFGKACRYNHTKIKVTAAPLVELNFLGLPIRLGEKECPYYMRTGSCKYAANCRFNHPDPSVEAGDPSPEYLNGVSAPLSSGSRLSVASWSTPGSLKESAPFIPLMYSPTHGVPSHSTDWNRYQYQLNARGPSVNSATAYVPRSPMTEGNLYSQYQQHVMGDEFPERPGQPECSYFMKTGDCKFKSNCKYHHPKDRAWKSPSVMLSDKGLPLRPDKNICSYYSRYGICKFGPACKFDHSINLAPPHMGGADQLPSAVESVDWDGSANEVVRNAEEGGGIQQSV